MPNADLNKIFGNSPAPDVLLQRLMDSNSLIRDDEKILIIGASGQIGSFLVPSFQKSPAYKGNLVLADVGEKAKQPGWTHLDVSNDEQYSQVVVDNNVKVIINLAALLSGAAAANPELAHAVNVKGAENTFNIAYGLGVRHVLIPSSIAAAEFRKDPMDGRDEAKRKEAERKLMPLKPKYHATSNYGLAKRMVMSLAELYTKGYGMRCYAPVLAGVWTCMSTGPSDGTTEELDRLVVTAANTAVSGENVVYNPKLPPQAKFPMIDGRTLATALMVYMHAMHLDKDFEPALLFAEHSVTVGEVATRLQAAVKGFKVEFDSKKYDAGKVERASIWPEALDMYATENMLGFKPNYTWKQSVDYHLKRCVREIRDRNLAVQGIRPAERNSDGRT